MATETNVFEFTGKQSKYNYQETKEQKVIIHYKKTIKSGFVYLCDKGFGLALSFHNKKGIEKDYINNVSALKNMESAKKWFDTIN